MMLTGLDLEVQNYFSSEDGPFREIQLTILQDNGGWVAGGAISSLLCGREIRDVDVYVPSFEVAMALAEDSIIISSSDKALVCAPREQDMPPVQIIFDRYYQRPEHIFDSFDFTACMAAYCLKEEKLYMHDRFLQDNLSRTLRFNSKTLYPIMSSLRVEKYKEYGYSISQLENLKILTAISQLSIENMNDLKQQIGGMYGSMMDIRNVNSLDDFFNAEPVLAVQTLDQNANHISRLIHTEYPFLRDIIVKSAKKVSDGVYRSSIASSSRAIDYHVGSVLDTDTIKDGQNKWIYASPVSASLPGYNGGEVLQMEIIERRPVPKGANDTWTDSFTHSGRFEVTRVLCSVEEWNKKSLEERINMVKQ